MGAPSSTATTSASNNNSSKQALTATDDSCHVRVVTRIRPLSQKELQSGNKTSVTCLSKNPHSHDEASSPTTLVQVNGCSAADKRWFEFDAVLDGHATQEQVYVQSGAQQAICHDLWKGFNCTILAYGQTGAGKTFTMGTNDSSSAATTANTSADAGIIPRACHDLFQQIQTKCDGQAKVSLSYVELYNEQLRDLLWQPPTASAASPPPLRLRETLQGEVYVAGVVTKPVHSPADILALLAQAGRRRVVAATAMNATSSRSHAICTLHIEGVVVAGGSSSAGGDSDDEENVQFTSKLTLVDLAGSERIKRTGAVGARQAEGININKSLLVLGQVVSALSEQKKPPYRDSKLTRLLQDSLGGNSRTLLLACVSPAESNVDESINTLRYASRARKITNTATRNVVQHISPEEAAALQRQNTLLQQQVAELQQTIRTLRSTSTTDSMEQGPAGSPTHTVSTQASSSLEDYPSADDDDEASGQEQSSSFEKKSEDDTNNSDHVPCQISLSEQEEQPQQQKVKTQERPTLDVRTADVAEYIIEISNLKVQVAQLTGEVDEHKFLAKRHAELQIRYAEAQAEADSARMAATYLSNIVDELREMKQNQIDRKQQLLQMKLKEQNMFSLVHAMLETYRMQVGRLSTEFEKSVVRTLQQEKDSSHSEKPSSSARPQSAYYGGRGTNDDGNDDNESVGSVDSNLVTGSVASKSGASLLDMKSVGSLVDTTRSVGSFLYKNRRFSQTRQWFKNATAGVTTTKDAEPVMSWSQATRAFQSKINEIQTNIGNDVESLLSNMSRLADETQTLEQEIGQNETDSKLLLSAYEEDNKNELVDHLSSMLVVKQA